MTAVEVVAEHPDLELEDARQALAYAAMTAEEEVHSLPAGIGPNL